MDATGYSSLGNLGASGIDYLDSTNGESSMGASIGSGALSGAGTGAALGSVVPGVGTAIGAAGGAIVGGISGWMEGNKEQELEEQQKEMRRKMAARKNRRIVQNYDSEGVKKTGLYLEKGGKIPGDYYAEKGEVIMHKLDNMPTTDENGSLQKLSTNYSKIKGDSHEADSGGVGMSGGEKIYSDELEVSDELYNQFKRL